MNSSSPKPIASIVEPDIGKKVDELFRETQGFKKIPNPEQVKRIKAVFIRAHKCGVRELYDTEKYRGFREYADDFGLDPGRYWKSDRLGAQVEYMRREPKKYFPKY